jgi:hypothetical protein
LAKPLIAIEARVDLTDACPPLHQPCDLPSSAPPVLVVVVDTGEEFDWSAPFDRAGTGVAHMAAIDRLQDVFDASGVVPSYLVSYAIVAQEAGYRPLQRYLAAGRAVIGAHLNPWAAPPRREQLNAVNSYPGNLPRELAAAKLAALSRQIERALGLRPTIYKAGRYGKGPNTEAILEEQGFESTSARRRPWIAAPTAGQTIRAIRRGPSCSASAVASCACPTPALSWAGCTSAARVCIHSSRTDRSRDCACRPSPRASACWSGCGSLPKATRSPR